MEFWLDPSKFSCSALVVSWFCVGAQPKPDICIHVCVYVCALGPKSPVVSFGAWKSYGTILGNLWINIQIFSWIWLHFLENPAQMCTNLCGAPKGKTKKKQKKKNTKKQNKKTKTKNTQKKNKNKKTKQKTKKNKSKKKTV